MCACAQAAEVERTPTRTRLLDAVSDTPPSVKMDLDAGMDPMHQSKLVPACAPACALHRCT